MKKDNAGIQEKLRCRRAALAALGASGPVLETHAGFGVIGGKLYGSDGVAIEKDRGKAEALAAERATWRVYCGDSARALRDGLAAEVPFSFIDLDPYGEPWPTIEAFLSHRRSVAPRFAFAVNDGLRQKIKITGGWDVGSLVAACECFGSGFYRNYLEVAEWNLRRLCHAAGVEVAEFRGFYGGFLGQMSHYYAVVNAPSGTLGVG